MGIGDAFRELGEFLDECERREQAVETVEVADCAGSTSGEELAVDVEVCLATGRRESDGCALAARAPSIGHDGTLRLELESTEALIPADDYAVDVEPTGATVDADGTVAVAFSAAVPAADPGTSASGDVEVDDPAEPDDSDGGEPATTSVGDSDVPPFKNPDLLADVYESCDTFSEMADSLGMDVTAETVRRYMIDYDIHQPESYRTGSDSGDDGDGADTPDAGDGEEWTAAGEAGTGQPVVLSDGIGLPDDVTVDTLIETVERSNTIYEVKQDIGIDRQDALDMLQELNLLDLVVGRLATEAERDISRDDVVARLREASATQ